MQQLESGAGNRGSCKRRLGLQGLPDDLSSRSLLCNVDVTYTKKIYEHPLGSSGKDLETPICGLIFY